MNSMKPVKPVKPVLTTDQIMEIMVEDKKLHDMPIAIITMGIPGSGKSTLVRRIIETKLGKIMGTGNNSSYKFSDFVNCNPDEILHYIDEPDAKARLAKASRKNAAILKKIRESPDEKYSVIYDGTGVNKSAYKGNINKFIQNGYFTLLVYVKTNPFIVRERMKKRTRKVDSNKVQSMFLKLNNNVNENNDGNPMKLFDYYKKMVLENKNGGAFIELDNTFKRVKITDSSVNSLSLF